MFDRFRFTPVCRKRKSSDLGTFSPSSDTSHSASSAVSSTSTVLTSYDAQDDQEMSLIIPKKSRKNTLVKSSQSEKAGSKSKWQERWHGICTKCFEKRTKCDHFQEKRLRLLIVGHNPSHHAWETGFSYSNPSNRMWSLLTGNFPPLLWDGILPLKASIHEQNTIPHSCGVGFTSIGLEVSDL